MTSDAATMTIEDTWIMYQEQLELTFNRVDPGTAIVYAVGDLGYARQTQRGNKARDTHDTAEYAYDLWKRGEADLVQKRLGPHRTEYMAVKR